MLQKNTLMLARHGQFGPQMHLAQNPGWDGIAQSSRILYDPSTEGCNYHSGCPKSLQYGLKKNDSYKNVMNLSIYIYAYI